MVVFPTHLLLLPSLLVLARDHGGRRGGQAELAADLRIDFFHLFYLPLELKPGLFLLFQLLFQFAYVSL